MFSAVIKKRNMCLSHTHTGGSRDINRTKFALTTLTTLTTLYTIFYIHKISNIPNNNTILDIVIPKAISTLIFTEREVTIIALKQR